jgi:hypothetical protein
LSQLLVAGVLLMGFVIYMTTMLSLTAMLALMIQRSVLDLRFRGSPADVSSPADAGVLIAAPGAPGQAAGEVARQSRALRAAGPGGTTGCGESGEGDGGAFQPLILGAGGDSLQPSDGLNDVLAILERPVREIFPSNRVAMRCAGCGEAIPRFEGYRHIRVGVKKTYCESCHEAMGLPLRAPA